MRKRTVIDIILRELGFDFTVRELKERILRRFRNSLSTADWVFIIIAGVLLLFTISEAIYILFYAIIEPISSAADTYIPGGSLLNQIASGLGVLFTYAGKILSVFFLWLLGLVFLVAAFLIWGVGVFKNVISYVNGMGKTIITAWLFLILSLIFHIVIFVRI